jgi:hypothetical protein
MTYLGKLLSLSTFVTKYSCSSFEGNAIFYCLGSILVAIYQEHLDYVKLWLDRLRR